MRTPRSSRPWRLAVALAIVLGAPLCLSTSPSPQGFSIREVGATSGPYFGLELDPSGSNVPRNAKLWVCRGRYLSIDPLGVATLTGPHGNVPLLDRAPSFTDETMLVEPASALEPSAPYELAVFEDVGRVFDHFHFQTGTTFDDVPPKLGAVRFAEMIGMFARIWFVDLSDDVAPKCAMRIGVWSDARGPIDLDEPPRVLVRYCDPPRMSPNAPDALLFDARRLGRTVESAQSVTLALRAFDYAGNVSTVVSTSVTLPPGPILPVPKKSPPTLAPTPPDSTQEGHAEDSKQTGCGRCGASPKSSSKTLPWASITLGALVLSRRRARVGSQESS